MAVTKIWDIHDRLDKVVRYTANIEKTINKDYMEIAKLHSIDEVIQYTADEMKTEKQFYVTGVNCSNNPDDAIFQMKQTKKNYGKEGGIICFHAYQSFLRGETTPVTAHRIGVEFAKHMWGDRFEVLVSTHLNTGTVHNHFVLNSVSFADGLKYYDNRTNYLKMRKLSDTLCREYGLSIIENPRRGQSPKFGEIKMKEAGKFSARDKIRQDIDIAVETNIAFKYFAQTFESLGYTLEWRGKYLRARPDGTTYFFRLDKLGDGYTEADINRRLTENFRKSRNTLQGFTYTKAEKPTGLRSLYLHYCYLLEELPKKRPCSREMYKALKEERNKIEMYSNEAKLLDKYQIDTAEQLSIFTEKISNEYIKICTERKKLRNRLRHLRSTETMQPIRDEVFKLTNRISEIHKEMKLCEDIALRSGAVEAVINKIYTPCEKEEKNLKSK